MRASGRTISPTATEKRRGSTAKSPTKATSTKAKKLGVVATNGKTAATMKVTSKTECSTVSAFNTPLQAKKRMKATSKTTNTTGKVS